MQQAVIVDTHCAGLGGAERGQPLGPDIVVWRVGGHMFAAYTTDGHGLSLRSNGGGSQDGSGMSPTTSENPSGICGPGWVLVSWDTSPDTLRAWIDESYRLVRRDWRLESISAE